LTVLTAGHVLGRPIFALKITSSRVRIWTSIVSTRVHIPNGVSFGSADFAQHTAESPCTSQWAASFPLRIARSHMGSQIWTPV